jgi:hypothetical protein
MPTWPIVSSAALQRWLLPKCAYEHREQEKRAAVGREDAACEGSLSIRAPLVLRFLARLTVEGWLQAAAARDAGF